MCRLGVVADYPMRNFPLAHKGLNHSGDAERKAQFDVFGEVTTQIVAVESIKDFKRFSEGSYLARVVSFREVAST